MLPGWLSIVGLSIRDSRESEKNIVGVVLSSYIVTIKQSVICSTVIAIICYECAQSPT